MKLRIVILKERDADIEGVILSIMRCGSYFEGRHKKLYVHMCVCLCVCGGVTTPNCPLEPCLKHLHGIDRKTDNEYRKALGEKN